jgi:hypothetical protein
MSDLKQMLSIKIRAIYKMALSLAFSNNAIDLSPPYVHHSFYPFLHSLIPSSPL